MRKEGRLNRLKKNSENLGGTPDESKLSFAGGKKKKLEREASRKSRYVSRAEERVREVFLDKSAPS